ncbi:MAG: GNAT family N-acetyltransferase [Burkholderiaceae bacterium]
MTGAGDARRVELRAASFPAERDAVAALMHEYVRSVSVSLEFQSPQAEFAALPGQYAPPAGCLLVAVVDGALAGCGALRRIDADTCEMKRLYVRPDARGLGLGGRLVQGLLDEARAIGYQRICLDVLPEFAAAQKIYDAFGFQDCEPVSFNPVPGARFLGRDL